jgi:hypothetical protein
LLAVFPDDVPGRRDRALVLAYVLTARRKTGVLRLTRKDLTLEDGRAFYAYRGKAARPDGGSCRSVGGRVGRIIWRT